MFSLFTKLPTRAEKCLLLLTIIMICEQTLFIYPVVVVKSIFPIIGVFLFPIIYISLFLGCSTYRTYKWVRIQDIFILLFFALAIAVTCIMYPRNSVYIYERLDVILLSIPFFLLGLCMTLNNYTFDVLSKWCCIGVIATSFYRLVFQDFSETSTRGYNMDAAYVLLLNSLVVIDYAIRSKRLFPIICSAVAMFYTLSMGTRGPIVIIIAFFLIRIYTQSFNSHTPKKRIRTVTIFTILLLLFVMTGLLSNSLVMLQELLESLGFSTRILDFAISNEMISATSGRDEITADLLNRLRYSPVFGYGVYGEWPLGYYSAHNIYVEICYHFGYPIGITLLLLYVMCIIRAYITADRISKSWILILACFVFIRGFFGGSYLSFGVFLLLGYSLQVIRKERSILQIKY